MHNKISMLSVGLLSGALIIVAPLSMAEEKVLTAEQVVSAMESTFGVNPGEWFYPDSTDTQLRAG